MTTTCSTTGNTVSFNPLGDCDGSGFYGLVSNKYSYFTLSCDKYSSSRQPNNNNLRLCRGFYTESFDPEFAINDSCKKVHDYKTANKTKITFLKELYETLFSPGFCDQEFTKVRAILIWLDSIKMVKLIAIKIETLF